MGVLIEGAASNTIGGTESEARNVISGNGTGISIVGAEVPSETSSNSVIGNYVGTAADGTGELGNTESGIAIEFASSNLIGGNEDGQPNLIAFNGGHGVLVLSGTGALTGVGNSILSNPIFSNGGLGIHLTKDPEDDGVTFNDDQDPDQGPE